MLFYQANNDRDWVSSARFTVNLVTGSSSTIFRRHLDTSNSYTKFRLELIK